MDTVLILACLGARVVAVDRFFGEWQAGWHDEFVSALKTVLANKDWNCDLALLDQALWKPAMSTVRSRGLELLCKHVPDRHEHMVRY
jgi:hypothetical protein